MPLRNSFENEPTTASETPSARRPAAVTETLSVVRGFSPFHGSAVVTWSTTSANHARACSGLHSILTNAYVVQS
jgi:hypothetical protein